MLDWCKINIQNISKTLLIIFHIIFIISILIVDGYPQTNDILHLFKIAPLDGNLKFINGIFKGLGNKVKESSGSNFILRLQNLFN